MISTRGRYAIRVLLDMAEHRGAGYVPLRMIAHRQEISLKYIEQVMPLLTGAGMVEGIHGRGGGYRLCMEPTEIRIGDILRLTEGDLAPVACLSGKAGGCDRAANCRTLPMWKKYYELTTAYFDGITLADLSDTPSGGDYVIYVNAGSIATFAVRCPAGDAPKKSSFFSRTSVKNIP